MTLKIDKVEIGHLSVLDLTEVLQKLEDLAVLGRKMNADIKAFKDAVDAQFVAVGASLDNIVADEASLAKQIQDLKDQIAAGTSVLSAEDKAALDGVIASATSLVTRTKAVADAVPEAGAL